MTREGTRVGFEGSIHVPEDEICFFTFAAPSGREAALVAQRAGARAAPRGRGGLVTEGGTMKSATQSRGGNMKLMLALAVVARRMSRRPVAAKCGHRHRLEPNDGRRLDTAGRRRRRRCVLRRSFSHRCSTRSTESRVATRPCMFSPPPRMARHVLRLQRARRTRRSSPCSQRSRRLSIDGSPRRSRSFGRRRGGQSIARGLTWGKTVADEILAWRASDGFSALLPPYLPAGHARAMAADATCVRRAVVPAVRDDDALGAHLALAVPARGAAAVEQRAVYAGLQRGEDASAA